MAVNHLTWSKGMKNSVLTIPLWWLTISCTPQYRLFDPEVPGLIPKLFAPDLLSPHGEHVGYCAFSADGSEIYYAITNNEWSESRILKISAHDLRKKDTLQLVSRQYEGEPFISPDGANLYFMVVLPPPNGRPWHSDLYRCERTTEGWSNPVKLDSVVNSRASEWHASISRSGLFYFTSEREEGTSALHGDIYSARIVNDSFTEVTKLPFPVNTSYNDSDPLIAPDESFLIFHSDRPGGYGQHDLYISFRRKGEWSAPVNMGPSINTPGWEMAPTLTPDGKFLLYTYRESMVTTNPACIYWVSTRILKKYKKDKKPVRP